MIDLLREHPYFWGSCFVTCFLAACWTATSLAVNVLVHRERDRENARRHLERRVPGSP